MADYRIRIDGAEIMKALYHQPHIPLPKLDDQGQVTAICELCDEPVWRWSRHRVAA